MRTKESIPGMRENWRWRIHDALLVDADEVWRALMWLIPFEWLEEARVALAEAEWE